MSRILDKLEQMGVNLPPAPKPVASYVPFVRTGNLVFISGQLPSREGKVVYAGKVPSEVPLENAREAARLAAINAISVLADACGGDLDRVIRIVRVGVFVQSDEIFSQQPAVANGASDFLLEVFGDAGRHARAAVGSCALPLDAAVEIELIAEIAG